MSRVPPQMTRFASLAADLGGLRGAIIGSMPRRLIPFVTGAYYHIYNRGNNRQVLFFEPDNYLYFLRGMKRTLLPAADILAYCLMPAHYHLMVRSNRLHSHRLPKF